MADRPDSKVTVEEMWGPVRALLQRLSLLFIIAFSIGVVLLNRNDNERLVHIRTLLLDITVPVLNTLAAPVDSYYRFKNFAHDVTHVYALNETLRNENAKLQRAESALVAFEAENRRLRDALQLVGQTEYHYVTARLVGSVTGPFKSELLLNAGQRDGIEKNQVVITQEGLLGRVVHVGKRSAKVLQVTDTQSHIPVMLGSPPVRAILSGNGTNTMRLKHLPTLPKIQAGTMVYTSGDAGALPPDIPVGIVAKIDPQHIYVSPVVVWHRLDYVQILDYEASATLPHSTEEVEEETPQS